MLVAAEVVPVKGLMFGRWGGGVSETQNLPER